ncbi:hypothetical protein EDB86DRAFT_3085993 [Lactarius hatsudake]|nr:hypothetical protein EDB86DRAFT_3085993 [Lactarius hatsudake]
MHLASTDSLRPTKILREADKLMEHARALYENYEQIMKPVDRTVAKDKMVWANDFKHGMEGKSWMDQAEQAKLYFNQAQEALETAKNILHMALLESAPSLSRASGLTQPVTALRHARTTPASASAPSAACSLSPPSGAGPPSWLASGEVIYANLMLYDPRKVIYADFMRHHPKLLLFVETPEEDGPPMPVTTGTYDNDASQPWQGALTRVANHDDENGSSGEGKYFTNATVSRGHPRPWRQRDNE